MVYMVIIYDAYMHSLLAYKLNSDTMIIGRVNFTINTAELFKVLIYISIAHR